jgi:hypothetical protein
MDFTYQASPRKGVIRFLLLVPQHLTFLRRFVGVIGVGTRPPRRAVAEMGLALLCLLREWSAGTRPICRTGESCRARREDDREDKTEWHPI